MKKRQPKKEKGFAKNKKAFDTVLSAYRGTGVVSVSAVDIGAAAKGSTNPAKPTPLDFRCDVDKAVKLRLKGTTREQFDEAYVNYDSDDALEMELHAQSVLGNKRHSIEQRLGAEFVRRGLFPVHGRGYFHVVR